MSEEFIQKVNKSIRGLTIFGIILLIYLTILPYLIFMTSNSMIISSIFALADIILILVLLAFVPHKIYIAEDGDLIVCGLVFRRAKYGKVMRLLEAMIVPDFACYSGNRGFLGYWALCSDGDNTFIFISKRKCRKLYEIVTHSHKIYLCTEKEIKVSA